MKTEETLRILEKYVGKKKHDAVKEISKDIDGYDVVLNDGWLFERNNTGFIAETIKELIADFKKVEKYEEKEYSAIMASLGNVKQEANEVVLDIDEDEDEEEDYYMDPIQIIVEF